MELRQLRYFIALADHLHFGRAAEFLELTPSALSMQLQALERELGVKLVQRTKRSVALTAAGRLFLDEAHATLEQARRTETIARRAGRGEVGTLEIGYVISAACSGIAQRLLSDYHKAFPGVRVTLQQLESPLQIQLLEQGKLDACIVRSVAGDPDAFDRLVVLREEVVAALPSEHRLAREETVRARDLAGETFITPQFQRDFGFAKHLFSIGQKADFLPQVGLGTRDFITALTLVAGGSGVAVVPHSVRTLQIPGIVYRRFSDVNEESTLTMVFRRNDRSPFVTQLRKQAEGLAARLQQELNPKA